MHVLCQTAQCAVLYGRSTFASPSASCWRGLRQCPCTRLLFTTSHSYRRPFCTASPVLVTETRFVVYCILPVISSILKPLPILASSRNRTLHGNKEYHILRLKDSSRSFLLTRQKFNLSTQPNGFSLLIKKITRTQKSVVGENDSMLLKL